MRQRLTNRRRSVLRDVSIGGRVITVDLGFDVAGRVREIFATGHREGSDQQAELAASCVLISIALQHGITAREMLNSMPTVPVWSPKGMTDGPASMSAALLQVVIEGETIDAAIG